jgi:replication-associated recombination protein RarA
MKPLVEKYRPTRLAEFAGLNDIRAMFGRFASAPYSSAWLLTGQAGTGKTTLAYAVAELIGGQVIHVPSRSCDLAAVDGLRATCHSYPMFARSPWYVVIVDEADQMTRAAQVAFLSLLDSTEAPPNTVFIFTCNDVAGLEPRFLSRTRVIGFDLAPDAAEAVSFLDRVWKVETAAALPDMAALFTACDSNLRDCLMKLEVQIAMHPSPSIQPAKPSGTWVKRLEGRPVIVGCGVGKPLSQGKPLMGTFLMYKKLGKMETGIADGKEIGARASLAPLPTE